MVRGIKPKTILQFSVFKLILHLDNPYRLLSELCNLIMDTSRIQQPQLNELLSAIIKIILEKGPKSTTMDCVARKLGISKRTLYEIFESKDDMLISAMEHLKKTHAKKLEEIFRRNDSDMMKALTESLTYHGSMMKNINVSFFLDMEERYPEMRDKYEKQEQMMATMEKVLAKGVEQGVFLPGINYQLYLQMLTVQMESLKRMESSLPSGMSIVDALQAITIGFLRSIASEKGRKILDESPVGSL